MLLEGAGLEGLHCSLLKVAPAQQPCLSQQCMSPSQHLYLQSTLAYSHLLSYGHGNMSLATTDCNYVAANSRWLQPSKLV